MAARVEPAAAIDAPHAAGDAALAGLRAHANNFDAIRLFAALLVLGSHQWFFLGGTQPLIAGYSLGEIAVMMFFAISGFLVAESWYRDPHLLRFLGRRLLRIWPALAVATLVIALVAAFFTSVPWHDYFGSATRRFVGHNLQFRVVYDLPGVFAASPSAAMQAVNGSWWSIPVELRCYLLLAVLGLIGLRRRWVSLLALLAVGILCLQTLPGHPKADALHHLKYLCIGFFVTGIGARQFLPELLRFRVYLGGIGVAVLIAAIITGEHDLSVWLVIAPLTLILGSLSTPWVRAAGRFGDLSYGIYIYAYFVQQLVVRYWPGKASFVASTIVAVLATAAVAWCSWHAVEAPALGLKRHLRRWFPDNAP